MPRYIPLFCQYLVAQLAGQTDAQGQIQHVYGSLSIRSGGIKKLQHISTNVLNISGYK
jgi:hypothetical protein